MLKRIAMIASLVAFVTTMPASVQAETFVWSDPVNNYTVSFPDNWRIQTETNANNVFRIAGPIGEDMATCQVDVSDDGRVSIYPKPLMDEAVYETLTREFWQARVGMFSNSKVMDYHFPAGLGDKGDATAVHVAFKQDTGAEGMVDMYGVMIASIYGGKLYVASCSSKHTMYARYNKLFGSIMGSVQLESKYHIFATGFYRNFLADPKFKIRRLKPGTADETLHVYPRAFERLNQ